MATAGGGLVTPKSESLPLNAGLLERFLDAEQEVEWKPAGTSPQLATSRKGRSGTRSRARTEAGARLAYLHDETARIEERSAGSEVVLTVTSGPVGALVLIGECARRGLPTSLEARTAGEIPEYPDGALEARWDADRRARKLALPFDDVVELARYALA